MEINWTKTEVIKSLPAENQSNIFEFSIERASEAIRTPEEAIPDWILAVESAPLAGNITLEEQN